jgi:hypothetical protein
MTGPGAGPAGLRPEDSGADGAGSDGKDRAAERVPILEDVERLGVVKAATWFVLGGLAVFVAFSVVGAWREEILVRWWLLVPTLALVVLSGLGSLWAWGGATALVGGLWQRLRSRSRAAWRAPAGGWSAATWAAALVVGHIALIATVAGVWVLAAAEPSWWRPAQIALLSWLGPYGFFSLLLAVIILLDRPWRRPRR